MAMPSSYAVFRNRFLSTGTDMSTTAISQPVRTAGNTVVVSVIVVNNTDTSAVLQVYLEGSYDGDAWKAIALSTNPIQLTAFGYGDASAGSVAYPMVRLRAVLSGLTKSVLFEASIAFSQQ